MNETNQIGISAEDVARQLGVVTRSIYRFRKQGRIPEECVIGKSGKEWRFAPDTAETFLKNSLKK